MRAVSATVLVILVLALGYEPVSAQKRWGWLYSIHMFDALTGWAVEAEGDSGVVTKGAVESIVRTTDGGSHWRDVTPPDPPGQQMRRDYSVEWLDSLVAWASAMPTILPGRTVLFRTIDGGRTWQRGSVPDHWWGVPPVDFISAHDGWLLAGDDVYRSTDGGDTWTKIGSAKFFRQTFSIRFLNTSTGWIEGFSDAKDGVYHLVTRDGGHAWQQQKLPPLAQVKAPWNLEIGGSPRFFNSKNGVLPVRFGTDKDAGIFFYVTDDGGATWTSTTPVTLQSYRTAGGGLWPIYRSSAFTDANHGWVTDGDALYVTSDGGRRWTRMQPGSPFASVGELDFISPHVGWVTGQPLNLPFLLKTVDGGRTWSPVAYAIFRQ